MTGSATTLTALLTEDVKLSADGGGKVTTILEPVEGRMAVEAFLTIDLHGVTDAAVTFAFDKDGDAEAIFIVRNPDKIAVLDPVHLH